jgi:hypothetical protein
MSTPTFAAIAVLGAIGAISTLVLFCAVLRSLVRRELDDARFRRELAETAIPRDERYTGHKARQHPRSNAPFPARRGDS